MQVSSKEIHPGTQAKEQHCFACWAPFICAAVVPCSAADRCMFRKVSALRTWGHAQLWCAICIVLYLWEGWLMGASCCTLRIQTGSFFFQSALKWSIISFGQSWSVTVSEKQWLLFRLLGPTVLPPVCLQPSTCSAFSCLIYKQALCFCNGVKLEKQTYKHWWYGESRRKACSLFLQTCKNSSERSWE